MERILFVGHGGLPNGFSRVIHSLLSGLQGTYELHHLAVNLAQAYPADGWRVHPNPYLPELHSIRALSETLEHVRPDIVFILDEAWVCARYQSVLAGFRVILYCAIDGEDAVPPPIAAGIGNASALVVFTQFARSIVGRDACVVPLGVDTSTFFPIAGGGITGFRESRRRARAILFPHRPELEDAFIVLNANRNQPWKRIDICIEGFAKFAQGKPSNVKLYLHMGSRPATPGTPSLVDRFGVRNRLLVTSESEHHPECSSEHLNLIYNACDAGINTSEKEGWGLIAFEHGATGAAQIVPRHSGPAGAMREGVGAAS